MFHLYFYYENLISSRQISLTWTFHPTEHLTNSRYVFLEDIYFIYMNRNSDLLHMYRFILGSIEIGESTRIMMPILCFFLTRMNSLLSKFPTNSEHFSPSQHLHIYYILFTFSGIFLLDSPIYCRPDRIVRISSWFSSVSCLGDNILKLHRNRTTKDKDIGGPKVVLG